MGCQGSCCELPPDMVDPETETEGETETDEIETEREEQTNNGTGSIWVGSSTVSSLTATCST